MLTLTSSVAIISPLRAWRATSSHRDDDSQPLEICCQVWSSIPILSSPAILRGGLSWLHGPRARAEEPIHWPASASPICSLFSAHSPTSWVLRGGDTGRNLVFQLRSRLDCLWPLHLRILRLSHATPIPQTGRWSRLSRTTQKALCRHHTALPHLCHLQISADGLRQLTVTVVALADYGR